MAREAPNGSALGEEGSKNPPRVSEPPAGNCKIPVRWGRRPCDYMQTGLRGDIGAYDGDFLATVTPFWNSYDAPCPRVRASPINREVAAGGGFSEQPARVLGPGARSSDLASLVRYC